MQIIDEFKNVLKSEVNYLNKFKLVFISAVIFSIIANAYCWFDFNFSHDSTPLIQDDFLWQVAIGRYLHPIYVLIRGKLFSPFIVGALSVLFLIITTYLVCEIFNIKKVFNVILTTGILVANSVITYISATYIFELDVYMFSLMCSVLAVYFCKNYKYGLLLSILLLAISLGLYQSYWQVAIIIIMISLIKDLLLGEKLKEVFCKSLKYLLALIGSLIVYYIGSKLFLLYYHINMVNSYNSLSNISGLLKINNLTFLIKNCYKYFFHNILNLHIYNSKFVRPLILLSIISSLLLIGYKALKSKIELKEFFFMLVLLLLLPLGGNIIFIISQGVEHDLMTYSFLLVFIIFLILSENANITNHRLFKNVYDVFIKIVCLIIIFNSIIYSNQVYMKKHVEYELTYATLNRIIESIEQIDGYIVGETPVVFVGSLENGKLSLKKPYYDYNVNAGLGGTFSVTYLSTYNFYINNIMAYPMNVVTDEEIINVYKNDSKVREMDIYPSKNSIKMIDDTIIVKLSKDI